ncbi:MAG: Ig-like domain-containing protein [Ruminococcus sp.]|nr:Ig-like domain-containing protein [Ruminococcus sp.]MCI7258741.1 Ig-like domain-containing protein [Ruminococcus sp.]
MQFKKNKTVLAAILAAAMACSAIVPTAASAAGTRTKTEAYGDSTYAARFMSLYDDVITNGVQNGYMSSTSTVSGGLGVPYHSVETLCIEAPDYGHETTSEALSYLVWTAAMRDNIVNKANKGEITVKGEKDAASESVGDIAKAWKTMEATLVPDAQAGIMQKQELSATYSDEWEQIELYPTDMLDGNKAVNPIHQYFTSAYGSDKGLYLMHWLADVDDWYGFGSGTSSQYKQQNVSGSFTMINTFQRGEQESCWETIPHACVEELKFGIQSGQEGSTRNGGMKGFFNTEQNVAKQYSYTNAPDAEDRAIQAVYAANRWGVADQSVDSKWGGSQKLDVLAAKMGDETRNNMFDKYYKTIGTTNKWDTSNSNGQYYLMNWYTSWGGALDGGWAWQIGCSHAHEFYQNPLAAYALAYDTNLSSNMKAQGAVEDFKKSFQTQMEYYLWLLSNDGVIAGGSTNSVNGRYEEHSKNVSGTSEFNKMVYVEHPVYADPGSNHWIGNQVWAVQRLAELYYVVKTQGDASGVTVGGMDLTTALETILDKWTGWFLDNSILGKASGTITFEDYYEKYHATDGTGKTKFEIPDLSTVTDDGESFSIPSSLIWSGEPNTWTGTYQENTNLKATITGYGDGDLGCVSSLANTLIYYAAGRGISASDLATGEASYKSNRGTKSTDMKDRAAQSLYLAKELLDREWNKYRDDIGLGVSDHNTNLTRLWKTKLVLPNGQRANGQGKVLAKGDYSGKMPNGDLIQDGVAFVDIRSNYKSDPMYQEAEKYYQQDGNTDNYYFTLHRFWHAGDIMMALGTMSEVYPTLTPDPETPDTDAPVVTPSDVTVAVGETKDLTVDQTGCDFKSDDESIASVSKDGTITGVKEGTTTITVTNKDGKSTTVKVTVTAADTTTTEATTTTTNENETTTTGSVTTPDLTKDNIGDVNLDGVVDILDAVMLNKYLAGVVQLSDQALRNANCNQSADSANSVGDEDTTSLMEFLLSLVEDLPTV